MKTKLIATILFTVVGLMLVLGGTSYAQSFDDRQPIHQQTISNTVYLPLVSKPPCTWVQPTAYVAVSQPVVKVGDWVTITGALFNECHYVGEPDSRLETTPEGLLYPSRIITGFTNWLSDGTYKTFTFTAQAVQPGVVSIVVSSMYEVHYPSGGAWWESSQSDPAVIRIVP